MKPGNKIFLPMIAAAALLASACGDTASSSKPAADTAPAVTGTAAETAAQTVTETETVIETVTETAAPLTETLPETETSAPEEQPAPLDEASLREKSAVVFNGKSFSVGDKAGDIVSKIGEPESKQEVSVCDPRSTAGYMNMYFYPHITVSLTFEDICMSAVLLESGEDTSLSCGLKVGDSVDTVKQVLGEPTDESKEGLNYQFGEYRVYFFTNEGAVDSISVSDDAIPY